MKIFSIALIALVIFSFSFVSPSSNRAAKPINYDESTSGAYTYHSLCANEDIDVTFRSDMSIRGTINGQKVVFKVHTSEQFQGVGRTTGTRYIGHTNQIDNQSGSLVNFRYLYSQNVSTRLISQGGASNFRSNATVRWTLNSEGEATSSREQLATECQ